jgi:alkylation response protein AidB-like acyl-CoA dehydrogenase
MNGKHDGELSIVRELAATFSKKELTADRERHDRYPFGPFFTDVLDKAHGAGLLTIGAAGEEGGRVIGTLSVVVGEISRWDASLAGIIVTSFLARLIINEAGSGGLVEDPHPSGEAYTGSLIAHASFENPLDTPPALVARKKDGGFRLTGDVRYVVLGGIAPRALVAAPHENGEGFSYFLVDTGDEGVAVSGPILSMGLAACPAVDMTLDDAPARLVGKEGGGAAYFQNASALISIPVAAMSVGIMKGSLEEALAYARERFQGGRPIVEWSEVRMILGRMALGTKVAELAVLSAQDELQENAPGWEKSARAAAIFSARTAADVTTDGVQLLGGYGYMTDYGQEKRFRDARETQALLGTLPMRELSFVDDVIGGGPRGRSSEHE